MSWATVNPAEGLGDGPMSNIDKPLKQTYKSWKKKYRKMKYDFDIKMRESNQLCGDELKAMKLAKRLQEQNDQLLDLLLDVNESTLIPPFMSYDLRSPTPSLSAVPPLEKSPPSNPSTTARHLETLNGATCSALSEAKSEFALGRLSPASYANIETSLTMELGQPISLAKLSSLPHTILEQLPSQDAPIDIDPTNPAGYLTPTHEEEYLTTLDNALLPDVPPSAAAAPSSHPIRGTSEKHAQEKESQLKNPVSVYNWLRKHQPQVFLQDDEPSKLPRELKAAKAEKTDKGEKAGKRRSSAQSRAERSTKAERGERIDRSDNKVDRDRDEMPVDHELREYDDEDTFYLQPLPPPPSAERAGGGSGRGKRKREGDEPYRPKGGSSRPSKKKKGASGGRGSGSLDG